MTKRSGMWPELKGTGEPLEERVNGHEPKEPWLPKSDLALAARIGFFAWFAAVCVHSVAFYAEQLGWANRLPEGATFQRLVVAMLWCLICWPLTRGKS